MRYFLTVLCLLKIAIGQTNIKADCNTVFVCIDSISYQKIFNHPFIKDTLFFCKEASTNTTAENYTGKYAIGKSATLEFLAPNNNNKLLLGDHLYDFGIEYKTRKVGDLLRLTNIAATKKITLDTSTTQLVDQDTTLAWYQSIFKKKQNYSLSILEYTADYLDFLGFSKAEINQSMTYEIFNQKLSGGRKYPRQFDKISAIDIQIHQDELQDLIAYCSLIGLHKKGNRFLNKDFSIHYTIVQKTTPVKTNSIIIKLIDQQRPQIITISNQVKIEIKGNNCTIFL
jgi:hypothetical protein